MHRRRSARIGAWLAGLALLAAGVRAEASFHLFRIQEIYSSPDGTVQFVELRESAGADFESFWSGQTLTSSQGAATRSFTFPSNLPSTSTANRSVLVATPAFAAAAGVAPDFVVPAPFLFPGGGTLNYASVDAVVYPPLPADGATSVDRNGAPQANTPTNFAGQTGSIAPAPPVPPPAAAPAHEIPVLGGVGLVLTALMLLLAAALGRGGSARRARPRQ